MDIPAPDLAGIRELYVQGRYRQALAAGERFGPLRGWSNTPARLLAGRLAMQLGAPRLGRRLHAAAFRDSPSNLEAVYYHARYRLERFGPLSALTFMRPHTDWADAAPDLRADWMALSAFVAARLHDFDRADRLLHQAIDLAPRRPWVWVERAAILDAADRRIEAFASAAHALELHPWFRPAVQAHAHLLTKAGRPEEAVAFLDEATGHLESGIVAAQTAAVQIDLGRWADARASLERYADLSPLLERDGEKWLAARRADVAYQLGDFGSAATAARAVGEPFYTSFADELAKHPADAPARKLLAIDLTPADRPPSVGDLLARYWGQPYPTAGESSPPSDGLPDAADRRRAEDAGWSACEFTLSLDAAAAWIDAGVPFGLTLVEVGVSQSRLVVGYDRRRRTLFVCDGHDRKPAEAPIDPLVSRYASTGPRCLAVWPPSARPSEPERERGPAERSEDSSLPDASLRSAGPRSRSGSDGSGEVYDALHRVQCLLADADFAAAQRAIADLPPGHRLTKLAAVAWARATAHPVLLLDAADALLADFPGDPTYTLTKAAALRELGRPAERRAVLTPVGSRADADPLLMQSLAQVLLPDPNEQEEADRLLRRSVRVRPGAAAGWYLLATQRWERQQFAEATDLYRVACCLDDREEQFADTYMRAATATGHAPEALRLFQLKATRAATPHPPAVRALANALRDRDEPEQALAALGGAIDKLSAQGASALPPSPLGGEGLGVRGTRPTGEGPSSPTRVGPPLTPNPSPPRGEGSQTPTQTQTPNPHQAAAAELRVFRAEWLAGLGRTADAEADLDAARPHLPPAAWHKAAAKVARVEPDLAGALAHLKAALALDPLWFDGHRLAAAMIAETTGRAAAATYVNDLAAKYPHCYPALRLRAELLSPDQDDAAVAAIRALLTVCPHDAWARRQLALVLADRGQDADALEQATLAGDAEPDHPSQFAVLAHVHRRADRTDDAQEAYRAAVRADVDHELAVSELIQLCRGRKEKRKAARFVSEQLHRQPHTGDGLVAYRDRVLQLAADAERPELFDELLADLERHLDERPDLWQAWSLVIQQLGVMQRLEEARALAEEATERFPLLAQLWTDLARVRAAAGNSEDRLDALRRALTAAPGWTPAAVELAEALSEAGEDDEAVTVLERAAARNPLDAAGHVALADRLWQANRGEEALERAKTAVRHDPGFEMAWRLVLHWADRLDLPDAAADLARELTASRPGDVRGWLKLARLLHDPEQNAEALDALDAAVRLDPANVEAHDLRAERLAEMGRFDEALQAACPPALAADMPLVLQGRAAWVEAKRGNYRAAIAPMQKLVAVEPDYFWGWQQLAEWHNETGNPAGYLEASSELCRLKPDHPLPLTLRGEAKLKTNDRPGGKADLRDALRLAPMYAPAAAVLFDACLADAEYRDARTALAVLQEHAGGPEVLVKQTQFFCRTGDAEGALRTLAELAETPGEGPPLLLQVVVSEIEGAGWGDRAAKVLRDVWQGGGQFGPWTPLYWLDTADGEAAEFGDRLAAADAVIAAYPTFPAGYDRKAELLASAGKFDDAIAACRGPVAVDPPPVTLRGRMAWVEAKRGNRATAITIMKQAVADDPGYLWGWRHLAQWYDAEGRHKECLEAAEQMVRLAPTDPLAFGYRGEARKAMGDRDGAKVDFEKAFALDPTFDAAGLHLVHEQLSAGEVESAVRTLSRLQEHADGPLVRLRGVQVAVAQGSLADARLRLKRLAADSDAPKGVLRDALGGFEKAGWGSEADDELAAAAHGPAATPSAAAVWAERQVVRGRGWEVLDALPGLFERNAPAGREAVVAYAAGLVAAGRAGEVGPVIHRFADPLRADTAAWAKAGAVLAEAKLYALAANWLADWRTRDDLDGWMLRPLADALRAQDRDAEAIAVANFGLAKGGPPTVRADFAGWLALDAALDGRPADAAALLRTVDQVGLPDGIKLVIAVAEAVVMVQEAGPDGRAAAFAEAKDHLRAAAGACAAGDRPPGVGRWYKRAAGRLGRDAGTFAAKAWAMLQLVRPWVRG